MFLSVFLRRLYIWLASLALLVLAGLWLVPREDISVHDTRSPAFDLAKFFDGNSVAYGIFEDRFGNLRRQFRVDIQASQSGDRLILEENFLYDDGEQDKRIWQIDSRIIDGRTHYSGQAADITGKAIGKIAGNAMRWSYDISLILSGIELEVRFDDFIYQMTPDIAINRAYVSKWGMDIGSVTLVFLKDRLAEEKLPLDLKNW
ncbi:MAG: DUF3833 family protein [Candidatus Puniceispirillaceae bacterium]